MNPLKSILVHLDSTPACAGRLQAALQLGERHDAAVTALYAVMPALLQNPTAFAIAASPDIAPLLAEYDTERRNKARALFDSVASGHERVHWVQSHDEPTRAFARAALCSDLLVLGQRAPRAGYGDADVPGDFVESVLLWSGKPALVVPHIGLPQPTGRLGRTALVAWKETRESARALSASLPLLQAADQVHVAAWGESGEEADAAAADLETYLRRHGVEPTLHRQRAAAAEVGDLLVSLASDLSADLLVMGCYGHGRAREWALGGATRTVLASMTVPVLMVH